LKLGDTLNAGLRPVFLSATTVTIEQGSPSRRSGPRSAEFKVQGTSRRGVSAARRVDGLRGLLVPDWSLRPSP
jgi:hypothetical protein